MYSNTQTHQYRHICIGNIANTLLIHGASSGSTCHIGYASVLVMLSLLLNYNRGRQLLEFWMMLRRNSRHS